MSNIINKVKDAVHHGDKHSSHENRGEPRLDSDRDNTYGSGVGSEYGSSRTGTTGAGYGSNTTGTTGTGYGEDPRSSNHGPHSSNIGNKADPRVDSDMDNRATGGYGTTGAGYGSGTTGVTGAGYGEDPRSSNHGPHSSNIGNKVDPRVDSDRDNRATGGYGSGPTGAGYGSGAGYGAGSGYGAGTTSGDRSYQAPGSGNTRDTAGPHNSNLLNKADPRVDSDLDGSNTYGGNATYQ